MTGAVSLVAAFVAAPALLQAQELTWSGSVDYAAGSYVFDERFTTFSLFNSLSWRGGRLSLTGSLPIVAQNGTAISLVAGVPIPTGGPDNGTVARRQSGQTIGGRSGRGPRGTARRASFAAAVAADTLTDSLTVAGTGSYEVRVADPTFGATFTAFEGEGALRALDIAGWAKAPVATVESGVGTGAWDYGAGASLTLGAGETLLFADATWWVLGDMPDLVLEDALFYSGAVGRRLGRDWSMLASVAASTRIVASVDPPVSVGLSLSRGVGRRASFSAGASVGLSESASSIAVNLGWSTNLLGGAR